MYFKLIDWLIVDQLFVWSTVLEFERATKIDRCSLDELVDWSIGWLMCRTKLWRHIHIIDASFCVYNINNSVDCDRVLIASFLTYNNSNHLSRLCLVHTVRFGREITGRPVVRARESWSFKHFCTTNGGYYYEDALSTICKVHRWSLVDNMATHYKTLHCAQWFNRLTVRLIDWSVGSKSTDSGCLLPVAQLDTVICTTLRRTDALRVESSQNLFNQIDCELIT